jgi:hypothetical protein
VGTTGGIFFAAMSSSSTTGIASAFTAADASNIITSVYFGPKVEN